MIVADNLSADSIQLRFGSQEYRILCWGCISSSSSMMFGPVVIIEKSSANLVILMFLNLHPSQIQKSYEH